MQRHRNVRWDFRKGTETLWERAEILGVTDQDLNAAGISNDKYIQRTKATCLKK